MSESIDVLHVDDDPQFTVIVQDFLEREDDRFTIESAPTVDEGLTWLAGTDFDCIVSDYDLPDMTGIEFLETVREDNPDLPFILFTGKGSEEVASDAISAGVTDYLQKQGGTDQYTLLANRVLNAVSAIRSKAEASRERHRLEQILKTVPSCVVRLNRDGRFVFANDRAQEVLGLEQSEATSRTYNDPEWKITDLDGNPIPDEQLPFRQVVDSGDPLYGFRHTIEWPDGTRRILLVNGAPLFDEAGTVTSAVFALTDITEHESRQQRLQEKTRRLDLALRATETGVWEWNMETDDVVWSESLERLLGIEPGAFEGTFDAHAEYVHPDDMSKIEQAIDEAITGDGEFQAEFRMLREDGEQIWVEGRGELHSEDGPRRMIGITTDITDRKQYEQSLERQNERLEEFASIVSHDLRNPLNMAQGWLKLAREETDSEYLDEIKQSHDRMRELIENLLTLAREGDSVSETAPIELEQLVTECWHGVETHEASLRVETDATVKADRSRLQQLLENLIRNAVEHGGENVTITVGDLTDEDGFYITDDGSGIPPDERSDVFEVGYSTAEEEIGFGLTIVKEIVDAHDWEISVTDSEAGGARFDITGVTVNDN